MTVAGDFEMAVGTTPGAAATGKLKLYPSSADGVWHQVDESNVDSIISGATGPGYTATSATSFTPGTGSKAFTTQAGLAYTAGARVRASSAAGPTTTYMEGVVTAYTGTTLTVTVDLFAGTGAHTDWDINLAGDQGVQGAGVPPTVVAHGSMGATETFDYSAGPAHSGTVNAALTVTLTSWSSGDECILSLYLTTDGTGGYGPPTFGAEVINSADLTWDDTASAVNVIRLFLAPPFDGSVVYIATDVETVPNLTAVLAVSTDDIADALAGAASPAAGNVFATMADVGGGGGITHTTLGTTSVGGSSQTGRGTYAKSITLATDGFLAAIVAHVKGDGSNNDYLGAALYNDSSGPQNLLFATPGRVTTAPTSVTSVRMNTTLRWVRFPVGVWLPAGTYWIAVQLSQGNLTIAYDSGTNVDRFQNNVLAITNAAMDSSLSSFAAAANNYSIYADILR